MNVDMWKDKLRKLPLVAILRGISLDEVQPVAQVLYHSGFRALEIPLNSKRAVESIGLCVSEFGTDMLVGAGTVLDVEEVKKVEQVGCQFAVSPNVDASVIKATKKTKMISVPGVSTPSEAFMALASGADALKVFPAELVTPTILKAWRAVLPKDIWLVPVGGIRPDLLGSYWSAGANAFGLGSALFKTDFSITEIRNRSLAFVDHYESDCRNVGQEK
jgi:2-dehydro-3-deoxyphosphogalactonate aldolase